MEESFPGPYWQLLDLTAFVLLYWLSIGLPDLKGVECFHSCKCWHIYSDFYFQLCYSKIAWLRVIFLVCFQCFSCWGSGTLTMGSLGISKTGKRNCWWRISAGNQHCPLLAGSHVSQLSVLPTLTLALESSCPVASSYPKWLTLHWVFLNSGHSPFTQINWLPHHNFAYQK